VNCPIACLEVSKNQIFQVLFGVSKFLFTYF
jgi:hypothetical protein